MKEAKVALLLFFCGLAFTILSMVLGPLGIENGSIIVGVLGAFLGFAGIVILLRSWRKPNRKRQNPDQPE